MALGLDGRAGVGAAAGVLFAVNVTAVLPATPANVGVFQAACVAVLAGAYHVSTPDAIAYGIVLQAVEVADRAADGPAGARQRGPLLARGAPAHDARRAGEARAVAAGLARRVLARGALRRTAAGIAGAVAYRDRWPRPGSTCCAARDGSLYTGWSTDVQRAWRATARAGRAATPPAACRSSWCWRCRCADRARGDARGGADQGAATRGEAGPDRRHPSAGSAAVGPTEASGAGRRA